MIKKIHNYIIDHDNRWSFIIAYISLAVILAIAINLFWLCMVVAVHGLFEWIKQREETEDRLTVFMGVLWELKLDFGLILFGLALEVYMEMLLGVVGLGHAARAGVQAGGRFAVWQNVLRGTLLSVDDAAQVVRMVGARASGDEDGDLDILDGPDVESAVVAEKQAPQPAPEKVSRLGPWTEKYGRGDKLSIGFGLICLAFILFGPMLTPHDWSSMLITIGSELHPWPSPLVVDGLFGAAGS